MTAKYLLLVGAQQHALYVWKGSYWHSQSASPTSIQIPRGALWLVLDLPSEECLLVSQPALQRSELQPWSRGQLQQQFPGWFCGQVRLNASIGQALLHSLAITDGSTALEAALMQATETGTELHAVCFYSDLLARERDCPNTRRLILAVGLNGGIRHVLADANEVLFTRLCQDDKQQDVALLATCEHMQEAGLWPGPGEVELCVDPSCDIADSTLRTLLCERWPTLQLAPVVTRIPAHPLQLAPAKLSQRRLWLNGTLQKRQLRQRQARYSWLAGALCMLLALPYSATLFYLSVQMTDQASALASRQDRQTGTAIFPALDNAALQLLDHKGESVPRMLDQLRRLSHLLTQLEPARVETLTWQSGPIDELTLTIRTDPAQDESSALISLRKALPDVEVDYLAGAPGAASPPALWRWDMRFSSSAAQP
ncbi:hypothetical protein [Silvimonas amylolytica]|uniref:General secretion pathway protein L n=1 Tax=Silvimonas amylolytica TaxID=449663 RepID=A0ABQ2PQW7_9NEIS|nr:hypothetical protein [Silvimonas amylolytica]GGP27791.1 hypothetical protein GCM10010971_36100 [Silvimonas amylolytica]